MVELENATQITKEREKRFKNVIAELANIFGLASLFLARDNHKRELD